MSYLRAFVTATLLSTGLGACTDHGGATGAIPSDGPGGCAGGTGGSLATGGSSAPSAGGVGGSGGGALGDMPQPTAGQTNSAGAAVGSGGAGGASPGAGGSSPLPSADLVPAQGALLGAFVSTRTASSYGNIAPTETQLGRKLRINHRFFGWKDDWTAGLPDDLANGRIPLVTWEPRDVTLDAIIAGNEDELIKLRANMAKADPGPIFLRWGHEMNGDWYPWSGSKNGGQNGGPAKYIAAWRHIHDVVKSTGATNLVWVWCFNAGSSPREGWNEPGAYYPGDEYVDWVAFDGYNWGASQSWSAWTKFADIASGPYEQSLTYNKPIMVPETGVTELGGDKPAWVRDLQATLKASFPKVKALVYFSTIDELNKVDWTMDSSEASLQAFRALAQDPYFNEK